MHVVRKGGRYLFNFRFAWSYLTTFRDEGFDIIVDDMNKIPFFTPWYVSKPLYGITHHLFGKSIFLEVNAPMALYVYLMEQTAVRVYRRRRIPFIVGSPSTENELRDRRFDTSTVSLINYGVDHAVHTPQAESRSMAPMIGYFGRLKKYKCVDHLLQAMPRIVKEVPDLKLLIIGEGDDRPRLEAMAQGLGIAGRIEFTGFVSEERKIQLLRRMWFKVTTSSKEGWGLTVVEANACGTPVLASNVQGLRDAVKDGETGFLYEFGNIRDLEQKALLLLKDRPLRERLSENAIRWSKNFDWDRAARETLLLLERRARKAGV
jgi:glycosyltransferase involved in cell wall biosynthesis